MARKADYVTITKEWPRVNLLKGVRMTYKGKALFFPHIYLGESEMNDFDNARNSLEFKEADKENRETIATRKAMTICSRVLLKDAIKAEDSKAYTKYAIQERKRSKIIKDIESTEDPSTIKSLTAKLEEIPSLAKPEVVFPAEETVLSFSIDNMSGTGTLPVDNVRFLQAFQELNYFEQENVEDFMFYPEA